MPLFIAEAAAAAVVGVGVVVAAVVAELFFLSSDAPATPIGWGANGKTFLRMSSINSFSSLSRASKL